MHMRLVLFTGVLAMAGSVACSSSTPVAPSGPATAFEAGVTSGADARPDVGRNALPTITAIAAGNADFSTLVAALAKAGLVEFFDTQRQFTVFAPTNAAFDAAAAAFGLADGPALVAALDVQTLTAVLTYHVTRGDRNATSVLASGSLVMLDGNRADVSAAGGAATIAGAPILATDIRASNGIVHVIGGVMLPPGL
jgi:uncharacterized surface protein with fasciclin (FAS1) repeats